MKQIKIILFLRYNHVFFLIQMYGRKKIYNQFNEIS